MGTLELLEAKEPDVSAINFKNHSVKMHLTLI